MSDAGAKKLAEEIDRIAEDFCPVTMTYRCGHEERVRWRDACDEDEKDLARATSKQVDCNNCQALWQQQHRDWLDKCDERQRSHERAMLKAIRDVRDELKSVRDDLARVVGDKV